ncbi:membrane protein [Philodulcilactobacillus myokoensis]|uniref:Membrane protein n=1 Tax=Philodulcilactobacillus myokoensis TaxID=2929573 RepID=A0A9W6B1N0_9LACO|nr:LemA family protein [Philodulcilactobacillus myokoensis]GLB47217.1 membrane protein [Philodulcilactobacillus myokoensis]
MITIIVIAIIAIIIITWIVIYNRLVRASTYVDESWSQIDVQLKRRNDLIPNLISTTKGYANYEQSTLTKVTQLRQQLVSMDDNGDRNQMMHVSDQLSNTLKSIFAVSENYPELKANNQFQQLMEELSNTENKIAYSRQLYNSSVASFNMKIKTFPANLIAGHHHFIKRDYLEVPSNEKQTPHVNFDEFNQK